MATPPAANPHESRELHEYLGWLCRRYQAIHDLEALSGDRIAHPLRLKVPTVFVPQRVRHEMPPVSPPRAVELRFLASGQVSEHDVPPDLDLELLSRDLGEYAARLSRPVLEVLEEDQRIVLLGSPGAGKSTLARYLALTLGNPAEWPPPAALDFLIAGKYVPFIAELRMYPKYAEQKSFIDVIDAIAGDECPVSGKSILESCLAGRGNALVIFDGLDEVFDPGLRKRLKSRIREFALLSDGLRVIVTSRVSDYSRQELDEGAFIHYTLDDFGPDEVSTFAERFYRQLEPDQARAKRRTKRLLAAVKAERSPAMAEFAGNPLLLTALAFLARSGEIPLSRIEALSRISELLAANWDAVRDLKPPAGYGELEQVSKRDKLELLGRIARRIMAGADEQGPRNYLSGEELTELISDYLHDELERPRGDADAVAERLLAQLKDRDYILARFHTDAYGFVHRAFLDYLAVEDIFWQRPSRDEITGIFLGRWQQPAWGEALPLLAGLLPPEDVEQAILAILRSDGLWYLSPDPLPRHIVFAVRCLGEIRRRGKFRDGSRAIAAAIISLLEMACDPSGQAVGAVVAQALERDVLPVLADLPADWAGRVPYENWYLARGQFLRGERIGAAQAIAARIYVALLGRDVTAHRRLPALARWADSDAVRAASAEAIAENWPDDQLTARLLSAIAVDEHQDRYVRHRALHALAAHRPDEQDTRDLLAERARADGSPEVRGTAVQALSAGWHDAETTDLLRDIGAGIAEDDPGVRAVAVRGLAEAGRTDTGTRDWLWGRTTGAEPARVCVAAMQALAAHWRSDTDVMSWLRKRACRPDESRYQVRLAAVRTLAACWPELPETRDLLTSKARARTGDLPEVRCAAVEALAATWRDKQTAALLRDLAGDPDAEVRYVAIRALATYWPGDIESADVLLRLVIEDPDPDPYVLAAAATALVSIRPGDQRFTARLRWLAEHDGRPFLREAALRAIAADWKSDPAGLLKDRAARDPVAHVCGAAVQTVADGWHGKDTLDWLRAVGSSPTMDEAEGSWNSEACRVAVRAVAAGSPGKADTHAWLLERAADDARLEASRAALELLAADPQWGVAPETVGMLRRAAVSAGHPRKRQTALRALASTRQGDLETGEWLREHAFPGNVTPAKLAVIRALAAGWHEDPETASWIRDHAALDPDPAVRQIITRILDQGWPGTGS
jgi:hypothetical protein